MENIEVGEYVRTKYGEIGILTSNYPQLKWKKKINQSLLDFNLIKSHSKNIIDLIETGDILKIKEGNLVCYVSWDNDTDVSLEEIRKRANNKDFLLAIITKEQAKMIEYEVNK